MIITAYDVQRVLQALDNDPPLLQEIRKRLNAGQNIRHVDPLILQRLTHILSAELAPWLQHSQESEFIDILGIYIELVILDRSESDLDDEMRAAFDRAPAQLKLEIIGPKVLSQAVASLRNVRDLYLSSVAAMKAAQPEAVSDNGLVLEQAAARLAQTSVVTQLLSIAETVSVAEPPRSACRYYREEKSLHLDVQFPSISDTSDHADSKTHASGVRKLVALISTGLLKGLICEGIGSVIQQIYFDVYITKSNRFDGTIQRRYVLSVSVSENNADILFLDNVDPVEALIQMGARLSRSPNTEAIERFRPMQSANSDSASASDGNDPSTLSPIEFEVLVGRLFESLGFSVQQTQGSWDGGVDCIAVDPRPLVGGRILIQAKRFVGTVDVSVVRDLYGLVVSHGASKGVVVTTGSFGPTSRDFVRGKPLELIDGVQLRALLKTLSMEAPSHKKAAEPASHYT